MRTSPSSRPLLLLVGLSFAVAGRAIGAPLKLRDYRLPDAQISPAQAISQAVSEASRRFGVPQPWIRAVMRVESGGVVRAVSSAGAMGLMQVMPQTYAELQTRYALGADPFDIRDNVLAGAAYIRELADRYGAPAFLAAYNAGPARFEDAANGLRPLPQETVDYLARLRPIVGSAATPRSQRRSSTRPMSSLEAPLFVSLTGASPPPGTRSVDNNGTEGLRPVVERDATVDGAAGATKARRVDALAPSSTKPNSLFASRPGKTR